MRFQTSVLGKSLLIIVILGSSWSGAVKNNTSISSACHFTISEKSQEFMSPRYPDGGYPKSQLCTWRFTVQKKNPQTEQVLIKFLEFNLQKGADGDVVRIYSGWDEKAPLLAEFNGDNPPPVEGVASNSPVVYLVFTSDTRGKSRVFRGVFLNQPYNASDVRTKPITLPVTLPIKTTAKPVPASTPSTSSMTITTKKTTSNKTVITKIDFKPEENRGGTAARQEKDSNVSAAVVPVVCSLIAVLLLVEFICWKRRRANKHENVKSVRYQRDELLFQDTKEV